MTKSISILLGAGFSAPMGYPVGNQLNEALLKCNGEDFSFHTDGSMIVSTDGTKPNIGYKTSYDANFDFCRDLIQYFNSKQGYFDYEEFYDFFIDKAKDDTGVIELFQSKVYDSKKKLAGMFSGLRNIYSQLINHYLEDWEGNSWYDNAGHMGGPYFPGYTGLLDCLKEISKEYTINVHTLNHDLFFERLNKSDWISGELCDGFEELDSPYYGGLIYQGRSYKCRLQYYTGNYNKRFRLFKLHGSKDYAIYFGSIGSILTPEMYIKTRWGIGFSEFYKEIKNNDGVLEYERCSVNFHADFLTGTTSKIERYEQPLLYKKLFEHFRQNLKDADKLIIIGYGAKDTEINKMILKNFDFKQKPVFIIDPFPGVKVKELQEILNAVLITKHLENISLTDLNIA